MAKDEGELPDFSELDLPGGDLSDAETPAFAPLGEEGVVPPAPEPEAPRAEAEDAADAEEQPKKKGRKKREKKERKPRPEKAGDEAADRASLWQAVSQANPYTVMLGIALVAIVIAIFCLYRELARYDFNIKAEKPYTMAPAVQSGPANTIAVA